MNQQNSSPGVVQPILPGASISGQDLNGKPRRDPGQTTSFDAFYNNAVTVEEEKDEKGNRDTVTVIQEPVQVDVTPDKGE